VMTDNALAYTRSHAWRAALAELGAQARFTRRYRPQTNGKAERFNRTMLDEWAYQRPYTRTPNAPQPSTTGYTPTTTTDHTPPSAANHPSPASTTLLGVTASCGAEPRQGNTVGGPRGESAKAKTGRGCRGRSVKVRHRSPARMPAGRISRSEDPPKNPSEAPRPGETKIRKPPTLGQPPPAPWGAWGARPPKIMTKGQLRRRPSVEQPMETPQCCQVGGPPALRGQPEHRGRGHRRYSGPEKVFSGSTAAAP
jgi:hypothetical protein